jgi:hypothetical protein
LDALKTDLYNVVKEQQKNGWKLGPEGGLPTLRVVEDYKRKNPGAKDAIEEWEKTGLTKFLQDAEEDRWTPTVDTNVAHRTLESAVPQAKTRITTARQRQEAKSEAIELKMRPIVVTGKAPAKSASDKKEAPAQDNFDRSMLDFLSMLREGTKPQKVIAKRKYEKALTFAMIDELEKTPEGIKILTENANWLREDPGFVRNLALQQSPASVYATDKEAQGGGPSSEMGLLRDWISYQKDVIGLQTAKVNLTRAQFAAKKDEIDAGAAAITAGLLKAGVMPEALSRQLVNLSQEARALKTEVEKTTDPVLKERSLQRYDQIENEIASLLVGWTEAVKGKGSPELDKLSTFLKSSIDYDPTGPLRHILNFITLGSFKGSLAPHYTSAQESVTGGEPFEIPKDEADFAKAAGLE